MQDVSSFGGMDYVGTRFNTVLNNGYYQLDGTNGEFVSYGLAAGLGANAGSFCTSSSVIGTGVYLNAAEGAVSGSYTNFWVSEAPKHLAIEAWNAGMHSHRSLQQLQLVFCAGSCTLADCAPLRLPSSIIPGILNCRPNLAQRQKR
jgi:hypothetical protein